MRGVNVILIFISINKKDAFSRASANKSQAIDFFKVIFYNISAHLKYQNKSKASGKEEVT